MPNTAYMPVSLRAAGGPDAQPEIVLLALDAATGTAADALRLAIPLAEAQRIALALLHEVAVQRYRQEGQRIRLTCSQSPISHGSPSSPGLPHDGQSVEPLAKSSSACCGEG